MENKKSSRKWLAVVIILLFLVGVAVGCVLLFGGDQSTDDTLSGNPGTSQSGVSEPGVSEPNVTEPDVSQPDVTEPDASEPDVTVPDVSEPAPSDPDVSVPDASEPDASEPGDVEQGPEGDDPNAQECAHTYGQWVIVSEADCVTAGTKTQTCSSCGDTKQQTISAIGHNYGSWKTTKAATCELSGTKEAICTNCGHAKTEAIAATGHAWDNGVDIVVPTSCSSIGSRRYTCTKCDKKRTEQIKGTHSFGEWQYEDAIIQSGDYKGDPTSKKYHVCAKCNYKEYADIPEHYCHKSRNGNTKYTIDASNCQEKSVKVSTCPTCGRTWRTEMGYGPHNWTSETRHLTDYTEYTNELDVKISTCTGCGEKSYTYIEGKGWGNGYTTGGFGLDLGDRYAGSPKNDDPHYVNHPTWQTVQRNVKYDSSGNVTQYTFIWHDKNGNRYSNTVVVSEVPKMFADAGYEIPTGVTSWRYILTFYVNPYTGKGEIIPSRITYTG